MMDLYDHVSEAQYLESCEVELVEVERSQGEQEERLQEKIVILKERYEAAKIAHVGTMIACKIFHYFFKTLIDLLNDSDNVATVNTTLAQKPKNRKNQIMAKIAQPITSKHDYRVSTVPLYTASGERTGLFGTQREDTGEIFAAVSEQYGVIQNEDAVNVLEDAFSKEGMTDFKRHMFVMRGGAEMEARYDFLSRTFKNPRVGDAMGLRLSLHNSFDGSSPVSFEVGFLRLVCTNGMKSMIREFTLTKKHYSGVSVQFVREQITLAMQSAQKAIEIYGDMSRIKLPQIQGEALINNLVERKAISGKTGEGVLEVWRAPKYKEDRERNLYNSYNAFTQYLTHSVERDRFEMAQREQGKVASMFTGFVHKPESLTPLLALPA